MYSITKEKAFTVIFTFQQRRCLLRNPPDFNYLKKFIHFFYPILLIYIINLQMLRVTLLACLLVAVLAVPPAFDPALDEFWVLFKQHHNKQYTVEEEKTRLVFRKVLTVLSSLTYHIIFCNK